MRLARREADAATARSPQQPRFVAGSLGPTNRTASISPDVANPALRNVTFDELRAAYAEQARGLLDGGVDVLFLETIFDTLNAKAALAAFDELFLARGETVPVIVSVTMSDASCRTLTGQTLEAFFASIAHARPLAVGVNCSTGPEAMRPHVEELAHKSGLFVSCVPNAGLPNAFGEYDETPEQMATVLGDFARRGYVQLVGGCCGSTPAHVRAIATAVRAVPATQPQSVAPRARYAGLEELVVRPDGNFLLIGERTNVTGSRAFARLVRDGNYEGALSIARQQVEGGANILDVCMDEAMLDAKSSMTTFLNMLATEPEIARLPIMVDSSRLEVIEAGLKCLQGRGIVNSLSLKEGEAAFVEHARLVRRYGAAVVVMAFDEAGQATSVERKVAIAERAYALLTERVGFAPEEIIFDPAVLAIATGIEEHDGYGVAFIEAVRELKRRMPRALTSGGISNVSFAFRGNEPVRRAINAVFLYHAIRAGLDMGIVTAGQLPVYDDVPEALRVAIEDVIFARRADATDRLLAMARDVDREAPAAVTAAAWRALPVVERLRHALVQGIADYVDEDVAEARGAYATALGIIEGPLMDGMNEVGELFGAGKMFLPQVVKSARVMKKAVAILEPQIAAERLASGGRSQGKVLLATVKGDVHDIGKNIVGVVLGCNGYEIVDLGVMVPAETILAEAARHAVDIIGLSGLITPSLDEMAHVAREMDRLRMTQPLLIGGATTSSKHTAIRIAPGFQGATVHVRDASRAVQVVSDLLGEGTHERFVAKVRVEQEEVRRDFAAGRKTPMVSYDEARARRFRPGATFAPPTHPGSLESQVLAPQPLRELVPYIDWTPFFHVWELKGVYPAILDHPERGGAAREIFDAGRTLLEDIVARGLLEARGVYRFLPAAHDGDDIVLYDDVQHARERARIPTLRQQVLGKADGPSYALADFIAPHESRAGDYLGMFAVTAGHGLDALVRRFEAQHDDYHAIMAKALADRLAEAFAELVHRRARELCGFGQGEALTSEDLIAERYRGIRPAPGYLACPDHTDKRIIFALLEAERHTGITLTESLAMWPSAAVSGFIINHPEARYFAVGKVGEDQVRDYARRKGMAKVEVERWLRPYLGYEA